MLFPVFIFWEAGKKFFTQEAFMHKDDQMTPANWE